MARILFTIAGLALVGGCVLDRVGRGTLNTDAEGGSDAGGQAAGGGDAGNGGMPSSGGGPQGAGGNGGSPTELCGNGAIDPGEACDDNNTTAVDGCDDCAITTGFTCANEPSECTLIEHALSRGPGLSFTITDQTDYYDGTLGTMDCLDVVHGGVANTRVSEVRVDIAIDHSWLGDLVLKLVSPQGRVVTLLSRAGADDPADTYFETPTGDSSNLQSSDPITFEDGVVDDAESMGSSIGSGGEACKDDQRCIYRPNPQLGPGISFADYIGESPVGTWRLCAADGDDTDEGSIDALTITIRALAP